jgi:hypothetical protein
VRDGGHRFLVTRDLESARAISAIASTRVWALYPASERADSKIRILAIEVLPGTPGVHRIETG